MTGTELAPLRDSLQAKLQYARTLAVSNMLPEQYRNNPGNLLWAVEYGEMLGLSSMAAITGVHVIEGKPSASAGLISALVRRAGHKLRVTGDGESATCRIVRRDDPGFTFEVTWTLAMAEQAGLCQLVDGKPRARSSKGKPLNWETYPASMLKARAITQCARDACEEALFGLHYTPEELGAEIDGDGHVVGGTVEPSLPAYPAPAPAAGPEDIVEAEVLEEGAAVDAVDAQVAAQRAHDQLAEQVRNQLPEDQPGSITPPQLRILQAHMSKFFDRAERDQRLAAAERLVGRELTGPKDGRASSNLSAVEAGHLIKRLEGLLGMAATEQQEPREVLIAELAEAAGDAA